MNDEALDLLRIIAEDVRAIRLAVERERPHRPDDVAASLLRAIINTIGTRVFTCCDLVEHAALAPALRSAIVGAVGEAMKPQRIGKLLQRVEGLDFDGLSAHRIGSDREGAVWTIARVRE